MKKRLRKKLRLGEFVELGFEVSFRLPWADGDQALDAFWDEFVEHIESRRLYCAGACGKAWDVVIYRGHRRPATELDRVDIHQWLGARHARDIRVGPLFDTWRAA
ncbi:MAG: 50S ribosome-binding protein YggL [Vicinamibacterales bacterium]